MKALNTLIGTIACLFLTTAYAQNKPISKGPNNSAKPQEVKGNQAGQSIAKDDYWNSGEGAEIRVVQNRLYSKAGKFHLTLMGSRVATDPFLSVVALGASLGYQFDERWGLNLLYSHDFVSASSAQTSIRSTSGYEANTNKPKDLKAAEVSFSPAYGKLSLLGTKIIYFDTFVTLGAGVRSTESGNNLTGLAGLGLQVYLSQFFALRLDERFLYFRERLIQSNPPSAAGRDLGTRGEFSGMTTLGLTFYMDLFK